MYPNNGHDWAEGDYQRAEKELLNYGYVKNKNGFWNYPNVNRVFWTRSAYDHLVRNNKLLDMAQLIEEAEHGN